MYKRLPWFVLAGLAIPLTLVFSPPALGYVGPGAGLTLLSALWGLVAALFVAVGFIVLWPLRRWRRRRRAALEGVADDGTSAASEEQALIDPAEVDERRP